MGTVLAAAWWFACASLALAQDLLQEPSSPGGFHRGVPLLLSALGYLLLFLLARAYLIAYPSRALARAQLLGLWAEHVRGKEEGQEDNQDSREAREDVRECLDEAKVLLEGRGFWGHLGAFLSLLLWNGAREMAAWALMHRAERRAVALLGDEEVRARLVRALGELGALPEEERVFWKERLECALGMKGQDDQNELPSNTSCQKPDPKGPSQKLSAEAQRALLEEFLAALYDARDTGYARLLTLHNKAAWLLLAALGLAVALGGLAPGPWPGGLDPGTALLWGFLGGLLSRLLRVVVTERLPTDYGAYWVPLFLAPVLGALGAVGGYFLFWALVEAGVLAEGLEKLLNPPAASGLLVALGFSERLLKGLTERLEERSLKQGDQDKEKPQGEGGQGEPKDSVPRH